MANYTLIDEYIGALRRETRWLRDAEDIAEEVADHLLEAVERRIARGADLWTAQKRVLTEFGDPKVVGRALVSSRTGGAAMPTQFTRRAGYALIASALLWIGGGAIQYASDVAERTRPWEGLPQTLYMIGAIVLVLAGLLGSAGILGVNRRHGGALGLRGRIGFWLFLIAGVTAFATWVWGVWATALGLGAALVGSALIGSGIAPRSSGVWMSGGGIVAVVGLWSLQFLNTEISLGDSPVQLVLYAGILAIAVGQVVLGRWMATEEVLDESEPVSTA